MDIFINITYFHQSIYKVWEEKLKNLSWSLFIFVKLCKTNFCLNSIIIIQKHNFYKNGSLVIQKSPFSQQFKSYNLRHQPKRFLRINFFNLNNYFLLIFGFANAINDY